jgi:hypothetical protein
MWLERSVRVHTHTEINNSIQFNLIIIYVPSQQPNGQLQTQHSLDADIYIIEALEEGKK